MRAWPALPAAIARARVPRAPGASVEVLSSSRAPTTRVEVGHEVGEHLAHGRGVAGEDLGPQAGVAGGDPGDVAQALPGEGHRGVVEPLEPGGHEAGRELRHVRDRRDGGVVALGVEAC